MIRSLKWVGKSPIWLITVALISSLVALATINNSQVAALNSRKHYAVIIDCGSSGTRANLFEWEEKHGFPELLEYITPVLDSTNRPASMKTKPGASKLSGDEGETERYLKPISDYIIQKLPEQSEKFTAVYILGTAGLRLVEPELQAKLINQFTDYFKKLGFAKVRMQVISGAEEGMFLWLTVNSRLKTISSARAEKKTYGVIEMGGASVQVTYELDEATEKNIRELLGISEAQLEFSQLKVRPRISRAGKNYQLVSSTFLGLGSNSARENYVEFLITTKLSGDDKNIFKQIAKIGKPGDFAQFDTAHAMYLNDPCLPKNEEEVMQKSKFILEKKNFLKNRVGWASKSPKNIEEFKVILKGTGDFLKCEKNLRDLIKTMKEDHMNCDEAACTLSLLGSNYVPFDKINFIATGEFFYSTNLMLNADGFFDKFYVRDQLRKVCESDAAELERQFPDANANDPTRRKLECFKATWIFVLLGNEGFGLPEDSYSFKTVGTIGGAQLEWTLGALVDKALAIEMAISTAPTEANYRPIASGCRKVGYCSE